MSGSPSAAGEIKKRGLSSLEGCPVWQIKPFENLFEGLGFRQSADDLLTGFPAAVCSKQVNALEFLQNVSFLADFAGAFQAGMSGHFNNSCSYVLIVLISIPFSKRPNILSFKGKSSRFCIFNVFFSFFSPGSGGIRTMFPEKTLQMVCRQVYYGTS
jgi:hypothetical protein